MGAGGSKTTAVKKNNVVAQNNVALLNSFLKGQPIKIPTKGIKGKFITKSVQLPVNMSTFTPETFNDQIQAIDQQLRQVPYENIRDAYRVAKKVEARLMDEYVQYMKYRIIHMQKTGKNNNQSLISSMNMRNKKLRNLRDKKALLQSILIWSRSTTKDRLAKLQNALAGMQITNTNRVKATMRPASSKKISAKK